MPVPSSCVTCSPSPRPEGYGSRAARDPVDRMPDPLEPASERVAPEMLLHDEMRNALGGHPRQPVVEQVVKCPLADSDRRIGDDAIESHVVVHLVGRRDGDPIGGIDRCGVGGGEPTCPLVDVDRPDSGVRRP